MVVGRSGPAAPDEDNYSIFDDTAAPDADYYSNIAYTSFYAIGCFTILLVADFLAAPTCTVAYACCHTWVWCGLAVSSVLQVAGFAACPWRRRWRLRPSPSCQNHHAFGFEFTFELSCRYDEFRYDFMFAE